MASSNDLFKAVLLLLMMTGTLADPFHVADHENPGVCNRVFSTMVSRKVPYTETYRKRRFFIWRTETRVNFRVEYETSWKVVPECCRGYHLASNKGDCEPVCGDGGCTNGFCARPNVCECNPGYAKLDSDICQPVCTQTCINGYCSAPNKCTCNLGYIATDDGACAPHCPSDLPENAYCAEPDTFDCHRGYNKTEKNGTIECRPFCEKECVNGECVAPDECKCELNYKKVDDDDFFCEPVCEHICTFGKCTAPNTCTCFTGYQPVTEIDCHPICSEGCINGPCIAPEICGCFEGYSNRENSSHICDPVCTQDCINGKCIGPDTCQCNKGYEYSETNSVNGSWACQPSCIPDCGPHGTCIAPDTCTCSEGYQLTNQTDVVVENSTTNSSVICVPICNDTCVNGECTEPDICSCHTGYGPTANGSSSWCLPVCEEECENGTCVRPNECQCWEGFELSSYDSISRCVKLCYHNCSHGICASGQSECECAFGWVGDSCDEPIFCVVTLNSNDTNIDRVVGRNEINSTLLDAKDGLPTCDQCATFLSNETVCYNLLEDGDTPVVTCFISGEMPCSGLRNYDSLTQAGSDMKLIIAFLAVVSLMFGATATYMIIRQFRKRRSVLEHNLENSNVADQLLPIESISEMDLNVE